MDTQMTDQDRDAALGCFSALGMIVASIAMWTSAFYVATIAVRMIVRMIRRKIRR